MKNIFLSLVLLCFVTACGGRAANPVMAVQYKDAQKSCASIESELVFIEQEISRLVPKTDKTGKNVALGVAGAFLLVPWFFMDLSHAEQEEVNAYRQRYNHLLAIALDKGCDIDVKPVAEFGKADKEEKQDKVKKNYNFNNKSSSNSTKEKGASEEDSEEDKVSDSIANEIEKLVKLKEDGHITEAEFETQKEKLLSSE